MQTLACERCVLASIVLILSLSSLGICQQGTCCIYIPSSTLLYTTIEYTLNNNTGIQKTTLTEQTKHYYRGTKVI